MADPGIDSGIPRRIVHIKSITGQIIHPVFPFILLVRFDRLLKPLHAFLLKAVHLRLIDPLSLRQKPGDGICVNFSVPVLPILGGKNGADL